jgi:hypothetical protein
MHVAQALTADTAEPVVKIQITERDLMIRLRRVLRAQGKHLRVATSQRQKALGLGRYYVVRADGAIDADVDLQKSARELGLMQSWETVKPKG